MSTLLRECRGAVVDGEGDGIPRPINGPMCDSHGMNTGRGIKVDPHVPVHRWEG